MRGLSPEEVQAAAQQAANAAGGDHHAAPDGADDYYSVAHTVSEVITRQPYMLKAGNLREYQLVGLQWMISLYNNKLNGILADEMGLGKTVQCMALIAHLWESKQNYGPHLIIVPNAVVYNWKSEIRTWLPNIQPVFYVGQKDVRHQLYLNQVQQGRFNVMVTTYEFIMRDKSKLSKIQWKYVIIDEAQRMKDSESRLTKDLNRFSFQRRLLLTGTPLQNDLRELWSLLHLLLPSVFDNAKAFDEWFKAYEKNPSKSAAGKDADEEGSASWLERERKMIVVTRLHQILEPFMLRRRVEDVEQKLPPKTAHVVKCPFSSYQSLIYDWVKRTSTIRVSPESRESRGGSRTYTPLQNKCMELRKICNHPALNYRSDDGGLFCWGADIVRSCGKLWMLDRMLVKLTRAGHRVLLFSTMTKLLDLLESYLQWRKFDGKPLVYRRIDGMTALDAREQAIVEFNAPDSEVSLFLLSIRAAGRGLNLQTSDTVIVYDPDPNPKNEEQAIARSHRIGQTKEVRVFHLEAVADDIDDCDMQRPQMGAADIGANGRRYADSIETAVREVIQQQKISMADEVIDAGKFDQNATAEDRRQTLEKLMSGEKRGRGGNVVPSMDALNRMMARTPDELSLFRKLDEEDDWPGDLLGVSDLPKWLLYDQHEMDNAHNLSAKTKAGIAGDASDAAAFIGGTDVMYGRSARGARAGRVVYREFGEDDLPYSDLEDEDEDVAADAKRKRKALAAPTPSGTAVEDSSMMEMSEGFTGDGYRDDSRQVQPIDDDDDEDDDDGDDGAEVLKRPRFGEP